MVFLLWCSGCATWQQTATTYGVAAKEIVDPAANLVRRHVDDMADRCESQEAIEDYEACLGPIAGRPDATMAVFEGIRALQLSLYLAIVSDDRAKAFALVLELKKQLEKVADMVEAAKGAR